MRLLPFTFLVSEGNDNAKSRSSDGVDPVPDGLLRPLRGMYDVHARKEAMSRVSRQLSEKKAPTSIVCDGCRCIAEVRLLPVGDNDQMVVCLTCFNNEMAWRRSLNNCMPDDGQFPTPKWKSLKVVKSE